jgi:flagellar protein FlhE
MSRYVLLWAMLALSGMAGAQSYADRNLSVAPAAREGSRPIVIIAPAQRAAPAPVAAAAPKNGPIGSYASDAPGLDIRATNVNYLTQFRVVEPIPPGSTINNVAWRYGVARKPAGFEAFLCWQDAGTCWIVTDAASGRTDFFNGRDASRPFILRYQVRGKGPLEGGPVKGDMNQVIVTYDVPG